MGNEGSDDEAISAMLSANPLLNFSIYTQSQADALLRMKGEIEAAMDGWGPTISDFPRVYDFFWFWSLGAYEVLRTMDQNAACFTPSVATKIRAMKQQLAVLRMPFAKQELKGKGGPIRGENSVTSLKNKSFKFRVSGESFDARETMASVCELLASIRREDILQPMPVAPRA
ncbi:MAG: hypothetical protein E5Y55_26235 [Mesorhizobium sp.]|uniref:hypothetical protein n=1 Tax=Mesorhizobium sp. TaxID=1871066 RepID=UPI00121890F1|nr:hypothetical protein [Mesorhizobium sp.]TIM41074.1 MAG: hypothetical protein E5Y55_26235 [Mesorhizobium sp.]